MCGIAGIFMRAGDPQAAIRSMISTLGHRGPDSQGAWFDPRSGIALGHARLSIVDLSASGAQPMHSASGRYVVTYNGEIYNADTLKADLGDIAWRGHSDTEILLAAIERWGVEDTLRRVEGMFAFALWDMQAQRLVLARDRSGEKPLYYGWLSNRLVFASELKAIRAVQADGLAIDRDALAAFAELGYVPTPLSIFRGIRKLPAATSVSFDLEALSTGGWPEPQPYWSAREMAVAGVQNPLTDEAAALELLDATLRHAVKSQMFADVPLGAFLSGGIDSSLIVALMQAQSATPVQTFTVAFEEAEYDESAAASAVAAHLGTHHRQLPVTAQDARAVIPGLAAMYDEPFGDSSQIPTYLICRLARQTVQVALSGDAGDEAFGGYNRHVWVPRLVAAMSSAPEWLRRGGASILDSASGMVWKNSPTLARRFPHLARRMVTAPDLLRHGGTLAGAYANAVRLWPSPPVIGAGAARPAAGDIRTVAGLTGSMQGDMMLWDYLTYMSDDVLVKVDRASMRNSFEVRCPFLDPHVFALAWRLPISMRIRNGVGKWPLRQLLYRYVPRELVDRPKSGFSVPVGDWLRGPLREWAGDLLSAEAISRQGYLAAAPIQQRWRQHLAGSHDWSKSLWPLLMFQSWLASGRDH